MIGLDLLGAAAPKLEDNPDYRAGFDAGKRRVEEAIKNGEISLSNVAAGKAAWLAIRSREESGKSDAFKAGFGKGATAGGGQWESSLKKTEITDYVILAAGPVLGLVLGAIFKPGRRVLGGLIGAIGGTAVASGIELARGRNPVGIVRGDELTKVG